jgi:NDP-sugar pyrophosphorylase family protein
LAGALAIDFDVQKNWLLTHVRNTLFILAGGFGTRLRSVVANRPKPLAPVNGRPFMEYLIESWVAAGQREFVFLLHHQADLVIEYLRVVKSKAVSFKKDVASKPQFFLC